MAMLENAYQMLYLFALIVLGALMLLTLIRCAMGPTVADRLLAVNMCGTLTLCMIAVLTVMLGEGYLADVELIYTMLSFLAVVLFTKVYMGAVYEKREKARKKAEEEAAGQKEAQGNDA